MGFLEGLGVTISQKSNQVASKTRDMVEITNLNGQIAKLNKLLLQQYQLLGEHYYTANKGKEELDFSAEITEIDRILAEISENNGRIENLKAMSNTTDQLEQNSIFCKYCGAKIPVDSLFCASCGAKLTEERMNEEE